LNVVIEMDESTGGRPHSAFVTERVHLGWNLRGAISSHVELSDCRFALKQLSGREREPLASPLVSFSRGMVFTARAINRVERPSAANKMIRERKTSRCSVVGARTRASSAARSSGVMIDHRFLRGHRQGLGNIALFGVILR
jgi:hypothetical protein